MSLDKWDYIAKKARKASWFFGSKIWQDVCVKSSGERVTLVPGAHERGVSIAAAAMSISLVIAFWVFGFTVKGPAIWPNAILIGMGTFFLYFLIFLPRFIKKVYWETAGNEINIIYGFSILRRRLRVNKNRLKANLDICRNPVTWRDTRLGHSVLSLARIDMESPEIVIAISMERPNVAKALEKLTEFIGQKGIDGTIVEVTLAGGKKTTIPTTVLIEDELVSGLYRTLDFALEDMACLRKSGRITAIFIAGTVVGCAFVVISVIGGVQSKTIEEIVKSFFFSLLFFVFSIVSLIPLISGRRTKNIVIDKKAGTVSFKRSIGSPDSEIICHVTDVGAIQICNDTKFTPEGRRRTEVVWYEVDGVLSNGKRIFLTGGVSKYKGGIYFIATQLAEFFAVPLLDHTQKLESDES